MIKAIFSQTVTSKSTAYQALKQLIMVVLLVGSGIEALLAQDPGPINTERPGFTSSPLTMPVGYWQLEAGYQYTREGGSDDYSDHTLPGTLLRYGFFKNLEAQLYWGGYTWAHNSQNRTQGIQDSSLAMKWQLTAPEANLAMGLYASVSLPTGDSAFTSDGYDPNLGIFWTYSGQLNWFGAATVSESAGQHTFANAVGLSFSLAPNTGAFVEYLGTLPDGEGPGHEMLWGITWALAEDFQLDINGGVGLNSRVADYFLGAGFGYRF